ncbi:ABC transporter ATP-binding protein [Microbacterium sp. NPDC058389]|uniref:ABC transporter ATP-binding protein n=1 Tax=Microbacterium sp. NPDC058389 TaxID=3346475 RepID=UPI0036556CC8
MLTVRDLHVGYKTARVLDGIELDIQAGESVALLGRNGTGKTTLFRALSGLTPPNITAGSIEFDGVEMVGKAPNDINRAGIALVPQGRHVFGSLSVKENLTVVPRPRGRDGWTVDRVYSMFPRLEEREKSFARHLSGGEQQMLATGRALMSGPRLLLMDEPSEGLAPAVLRVITERLQTLRDSGMAVLVAEQNVDFALALSDRVLIMGEHGTIAWAGSKDELVSDPTPIHQCLGV